MSERAAHVTMLQRSPTYILSLPSKDKIADWLRARLPARPAYSVVRWKNILIAMGFYNLARSKPEFFKRFVLKRVLRGVGKGVDERHFSPTYNPWDQRLCFVPDGDLFSAVRSGKASVVTDEIESFTTSGIKLVSGEEIPADIVVTATGLNLKLMAGLQLVVDGKPVDLSERMVYKGMMYSDVPNLASAFGYTNASCTLQCDLTAAYVCRLVNYMDEHRYTQCAPRLKDPEVKPEPAIDFSSGYVQRALSTLPKQGSKKPWRVHQNYALDRMSLTYSNVEDGTMEFSRRRSPRP
jgi:cation diffusion facilitator CzcD-associated flavoprotein CzcO